MRRREFIALGSAAMLAGPLAVRAQDAKPIVGFLNTASPESTAGRLRAFRKGLGWAGYVEGRNVAIEYRWARGSRARLKEMAIDLVARRVDAIVATGGSPAALEAKAATSTTPIVFQVGIDPIKFGLVATLHRPGGNATGVTIMAADLSSKRLELLRELAPRATSFVALIDPTAGSTAIQMRNLEAAQDKLRVHLQILHASSAKDLQAVFERLADLGGVALLIGASPVFSGLSAQLGAFALQYRIPAIYQSRSFAEAGGLLSYGGNVMDAFYQAGVYTGRVLNGSNPADLPVHQSTKVELILNLNTAKALGLTVSPTLLARADEVIE